MHGWCPERSTSGPAARRSRPCGLWVGLRGARSMRCWCRGAQHACVPFPSLCRAAVIPPLTPHPPEVPGSSSSHPRPGFSAAHAPPEAPLYRPGRRRPGAFTPAPNRLLQCHLQPQPHTPPQSPEVSGSSSAPLTRSPPPTPTTPPPTRIPTPSLCGCPSPPIPRYPTPTRGARLLLLRLLRLRLLPLLALLVLLLVLLLLRQGMQGNSNCRTAVDGQHNTPQLRRDTDASIAVLPLTMPTMSNPQRHTASGCLQHHSPCPGP